MYSAVLSVQLYNDWKPAQCSSYCFGVVGSSVTSVLRYLRANTVRRAGGVAVLLPALQHFLLLLLLAAHQK